MPQSAEKLKEIHARKIQFVRDNMLPGYQPIEVAQKAMKEDLYSNETGIIQICSLLRAFEKLHRSEIWPKGKPSIGEEGNPKPDLRPAKKKRGRKPKLKNGPIVNVVEKIPDEKPIEEVKTIEEIDEVIQEPKIISKRQTFLQSLINERDRLMNALKAIDHLIIFYTDEQ